MTAKQDARKGGPLVFLASVARKVWHFIDVMSAHNAFDGASAIAFWFFLSVVPLLVFIGWLVGSLARSRGIDFLLAPALELLPGVDAEKLMRKELERLSGGSSTSVAPISIIGFLYTSSSGLHNLMDIFETAVKVERRPWWKQRAVALVSIAIGLVATVATTMVLIQIDNTMHADHAPALKHRIAKLLPHTPFEKLIGAGVMLIVVTTLLAGFYRYAVEHPAGVKRRAWPGAFVAVASWLAVSWGFGKYVSSLGNYALYYGGLAAVAVLLIWLYLSSLALVFGAEVNAQLEGVRG